MPSLSENIRAFVALRVSDQTERAIGDLIDELRTPGDGIRWASRANLHLTLRFLGPAVAPAKIETLRLELSEIANRTPAFELDAAGISAFPDLRRPRVLWVALNGEAVCGLAKRAEDAAVRCGFEPEPRAFAAHLTIARLKTPLRWALMRGALEPMLGRRFGVSIIDRMTLYRSLLTPAGSIYEALAVFPFSARP